RGGAKDRKTCLHGRQSWPEDLISPVRLRLCPRPTNRKVWTNLRKCESHGRAQARRSRRTRSPHRLGPCPGCRHQGGRTGISASSEALRGSGSAFCVGSEIQLLSPPQ